MIDDSTVKKMLGLNRLVTQADRDLVEKMLRNTGRHALRYKKRREKGKRHRH